MTGGSVTVTGTVGVVTDTVAGGAGVVGTATGNTGTEAPILSTVPVIGLGAAAATGDP